MSEVVKISRVDHPFSRIARRRPCLGFGVLRQQMRHAFSQALWWPTLIACILQSPRIGAELGGAVLRAVLREALTIGPAEHGGQMQEHTCGNLPAVRSLPDLIAPETLAFHVHWLYSDKVQYVVAAHDPASQRLLHSEAYRNPLPWADVILADRFPFELSKAAMRSLDCFR